MMPPMHLAEIRKAAGKSQKAVSDELGISVSTINRHENGKWPLTGMHRRAYADYYGVKADTIEQPERAAA